MFNRSNYADCPATVSHFRLDKYEVTVGRFRKFVSAVVEGWRPTSGAGKHAHLNSEKGLAKIGASGFEAGWDASWSQATIDYGIYSKKVDWDTSLSCDPKFSTWTLGVGSNENRPINCVTWYQAYAFCIWDGGFLPSEAEWNYAAAGGSYQYTYPWGSFDPDKDLAAYGCNHNSTSTTCTDVTNIALVGSLPAGNGRFGQSDLAGNIAEYVLDFNANYDCAACTDCAHLEYAPLIGRVYRGGWFYGHHLNATTHFRGGTNAEGTDRGTGMRCGRAP